MLEIVCFHDTQGRIPIVAGIGLPGFLLLNNAFNCTLSEGRGVARFLRDKIDRLLIPWLFWNVAYGLLLAVSAYRNGRPVWEHYGPRMLLTGTYAHLWFVPWALFSALAIAFAERATRRTPHLLIILPALVLGFAWVPIAALLHAQPSTEPLPQWLVASPATLIGFAFGRALLIPTKGLGKRLILGSAAAAGVAWAACWYFDAGFQVGRQYGAVFLAGLAFSRVGKSDWITRNVPPLLFGVYLVHRLVARYAGRIPVLGDSEYLFLVDFLLTAFIVWVLRKTPLRRVV
jgi:hypothetical protein